MSSNFEDSSVQGPKLKKNKLDIVIIAVILIGIVINSYLLSQQNNQQETALILLDERINANRNELNTKLDKVNDVALYNREDIRSLEDHVNTELTDILLTLDTHEHDPIYIKEEIVIEPLIEEEIIEEVMENVYTYEVDVDNYQNDINNFTETLKKTLQISPEVRKKNALFVWFI